MGREPRSSGERDAARAVRHAVTPWNDRLGRLAIRCAQVLLVGITIVLAGAVAQRLWFVFVPVLLACVVAAAAWPLTRWLRDRGAPDWLAAITTMAALAVIVGGLVWVIVGSVYAQWPELRAGAAEGLVELEALVVDRLPVDQERIDDAREELVSRISFEDASSQATAGAVVVGEVLSGLLLLFVVAFFLLKDGSGFGNLALAKLSGTAYDRAARIGPRTVDVLGGFVRGTTVVALVDAVLIGVALAVLGIPLAIPLAVLVFLGAYVPIVGATVAGAVAALVALVTDGVPGAIVVVAAVLAVNQLEGNLLAPVVLGNAVHLHPLAVLIAIATGLILAGVLGALLAVPLLAVAWTIAASWNEGDPLAESPPRRSGSG